MPAIVIQGVPEALKALEGLDGKGRANAERRAVRAAAKPMQAALKEAAASAPVPRSFQKVPAAKVSTRGGASGREIEARVRPKSPLFNIFEPGAGEHEIAPGSSVTGRPGRKGGATRKAALAGPAGGGSWTMEGRKRGADFFSRKPVRHPGMKARPILPTAFARGVPESERILTEAIFGKASGPVVGE